MNKIPLDMVDFIQEHHVLSMATIAQDVPVSCSLFYFFIPDEECFIFASDEKSEHIQNILSNPNVSATIHLETKRVQDIRGIQIEGSVSNAQQWHEELYIQAFPYAQKIREKRIWKLQLKALKYTDNTLGFAEKMFWKASD